MGEEKRLIKGNQQNILNGTVMDPPRYDFQVVKPRKTQGLFNVMYKGTRSNIQPKGLGVINGISDIDYVDPLYRGDSIVQKQRKYTAIKRGQYHFPGQIEQMNDFRGEGDFGVTQKIKGQRDFVYRRFQNDQLVRDITSPLTTSFLTDNHRGENPVINQSDAALLRQVLLGTPLRSDFGRHEVNNNKQDPVIRPSKLANQNGKFVPRRQNHILTPVEIQEISYSPTARINDLIQNIGFVWKDNVVDLLNKLDSKDIKATNGRERPTMKYISQLILLNKAVDDHQTGRINFMNSPLLTNGQKIAMSKYIRSGITERQLSATITQMNINIMKDLERNYHVLPSIEGIVNKNTLIANDHLGGPGGHLNNWFSAIYGQNHDGSMVNQQHYVPYTQGYYNPLEVKHAVFNTNDSPEYYGQINSQPLVNGVPLPLRNYSTQDRETKMWSRNHGAFLPNKNITERHHSVFTDKRGSYAQPMH